MSIEHLIGRMVLGTLLGGAKPSRGAARFLGGGGGFLSGSTLLTLGGLAWGVAETMQQQASAQASGARSDVTVVPPLPGAAAAPALGVPPPLPGTTPAAEVAAVPTGAERMVRLMIAAARADGQLSEAERQTILEHARSAGVEPLVAAEIDRATPLADVVAGITDRKQREDLYVLAFAIVRADDAVSGAERIFLAQLAALLGLDDATVDRLEQETANGIDGQA